MERRIVAQLLTSMDDLRLEATGGKPVMVRVREPLEALAITLNLSCFHGAVLALLLAMACMPSTCL
jgi:hypothetical protein